MSSAVYPYPRPYAPLYFVLSACALSLSAQKGSGGEGETGAQEMMLDLSSTTMLGLSSADDA